MRQPDPPLWTRIAEDREAFLRLGVCTPAWLAPALPQLEEAERRFDPAGDSLLHADVYSGNVCFVGRGAVLVDWALSLLSVRPASIDPASALDEAQPADLRHGLRWASEALGVGPPE